MISFSLFLLLGCGVGGKAMLRFEMAKILCAVVGRKCNISLLASWQIQTYGIDLEN